jgi:pimeloyl-ACP methyl ester carboxylesterase
MNDPITHRLDGEGPQVLLLNGIMMSIAAWDPVVVQLADRFRVVRADFLGQLLSPGVPPLDVRGHAEDIVRLLDHLRLDGVHVAGTSFGGAVGMVLAAAYPHRVRSLTAITTTSKVTPAMWQTTLPLVEAVERAASGTDKAAVFDAVVPATFSDAWRTSQAEALARRREVVGSLPSSWFRGLSRLLSSIRDLDLRPLLEKITAPVHVIAAGSDRMFPPECSRAIAEQIQGAALTIVEGAAHGFVVEDPARAASLIAGFVQKTETAWSRA